MRTKSSAIIWVGEILKPKTLLRLKMKLTQLTSSSLSKDPQNFKIANRSLSFESRGVFIGDFRVSILNLKFS